MISTHFLIQTPYITVNDSTNRPLGKIKCPEYPEGHSMAVRKSSSNSQDRWSKVRKKNIPEHDSC